MKIEKFSTSFVMHRLRKLPRLNRYIFPLNIVHVPMYGRKRGCMDSRSAILQLYHVIFLLNDNFERCTVAVKRECLIIRGRAENTYNSD